MGRLRGLVTRLPRTQILLETHDGSLADDPTLIVQIVEELAQPNLGLLFQPTFFNQREAILEQFRIQKAHIRHVHLQNRKADLSMADMREGVVPWPEIISQIDETIEASLEFVPAGICPVEQFDLAVTLKQVCADAQYVRELSNRHSV